MSATRELVAESRVPCMVCKKPHNAYRTNGSKLWGSWESLEDGHAYQPMGAEETAAFYEARIAGIRAVHDHGSDLAKLSEA